MKWQVKEASFGDIVRVKLGSIYHYGIFENEDKVIQFGLPPVLTDLRKDEDVEVLVTDINTFSNGNFVEVSEFSLKEKLKRNSPKKTISIANSRIGEKGYNLIHNNCEHFVNECVFGIKYSSQTDGIRESVINMTNKGK